MSRASQPAARIRVYQPTDRPGVAALWRRVYPDAPAWNVPEEDIARKLTVQPELFLVAVADDELAGTVMGGFDGHRGWVHLLVVAPEYRRLGIGKALMEAVERGLAATGCTKVNLQVRSGNEEVISFYGKLGYDAEERVSMGKRLVRA